MPTQKFWVKGLTREDETRIEQALRALEGVHGAVANYADECAEVDFEDDCVSLRELQDAMARLGFESRIAS